MHDQKYALENYSETYLKLMSSALENSLILGFKNKPRIALLENPTNESLEILTEHIFEKIYPHLFEIYPMYWGNSCQLLSSHIFAILTSHGISADIVYGEVEINGTLEFDTTLEGLKNELSSQSPLTGGQCLHAWVSLGGDTIIDAGLPDRMIKNYKFPREYMPPIIVGRATALSRTFRARYQPLLVGTEFLAKTNPPDPLEVLKIYS